MSIPQALAVRITLVTLLLGTVPHSPVAHADESLGAPEQVGVTVDAPAPEPAPPAAEPEDVQPPEAPVEPPSLAPEPEQVDAPSLPVQPVAQQEPSAAPLDPTVAPPAEEPSAPPLPESEPVAEQPAQPVLDEALGALDAQCPAIGQLVGDLPGDEAGVAAARLGFLRTVSDHPFVEGFGDQVVRSQAAVELLVDEAGGQTEKLQQRGGDDAFATTTSVEQRDGAIGPVPVAFSATTAFLRTDDGIEQRVELATGEQRRTLRVRMRDSSGFCQTSATGALGDSLLYVGSHDVLAYTQRVDERGRVQLKELILGATPNGDRGSRYEWEFSLDGSDDALELTQLEDGRVALDAVRTVRGIDPDDRGRQARARAAAKSALAGRTSLRDTERLLVLPPPVYVTADGQRRTGRFEVDGSRLSVVIDEGSGSYPLLIDPTMDYVQWLGGDGSDEVFALASNGGDIFAVGSSTSETNWEPLGFQGTFAGPVEGFVISISDGPSPSIRWGRWLGGDGFEEPRAIAVSGSAIYVAGRTNDAAGWDVVPSGVYATGCTSGFLARLTDTATSTLDWVQWVGGDGCTIATSVATSGGSVYVGGESDTGTSWQPFAMSGAYSGGLEGFVAKVDDGGSPTVSWMQWLGGSGTDSVGALALNGTRIFAGGSSSDETSWEAFGFQGAHSGGREGFVVALLDGGAAPTGLWGQWLGGTTSDDVRALAANGSQLYVGGTSDGDTSWEGVPFSGSFNAGTQEGYVVAMDDGATPTLRWGQWLGGDGSDAINAITYEGTRIYVAGTSSDQAAWDPIAAYGAQGSDEGFVVEVDDGVTPTTVWLQWVGGGNTEELRALAIRGPFVFTGGYTADPFDWEPFVFYGDYSGSHEGFVARLTTTPAPAVSATPAGSLTMTLEGPDAFGPAAIATGARSIGEVFPVSVLVNSGSAQVASYRFVATFDSADFHVVDPATGADITSLPNVPAILGSTGIPFQGGAGFPAAGPANVVDNTTGIGSVILEMVTDATDTDPQMYVPDDAAGSTPGTDRLVTLYFKAMRPVAGGVISFVDDTFLFDSEHLYTSGEWQGAGTPSAQPVYIDGDDSHDVSVGDVRLTASSGGPADSVVAGGDTDVGTALAANVLWDARYLDLDSSSTRDAGEPVYQNFNYPNDWIDEGELRIYHASLPAGIVLAGNADAGQGGLRALANVRQAGVGGTGTDLIGTVGANLFGVQVDAAALGGVTAAESRSCVESGFDTLTVSVTVSPVQAGVPVTLTASDMTGMTITPQAPLQNATTAQTDASGVATFLVTLVGGTSSGPVTFTADAGGTTASTGSVTIQSSACVSAANSLVTFAPACVVNDGVDTGTVSVTVRDGSNNPLLGVAVTLSQGAGLSTITPPLVTTDASGVATFTTTNTTAESVTYTATADGTPISLTAGGTYAAACRAVSATNSTVVAAPTCALSNGSATTTVTVTVRDALNATIPGATVSLAATGAAVVAPPSTVTDASGVATFTVTDSTAQSVTYTATATTSAGSVVVTQTAQSQFAAACATVSPTLSTFTALPACVLSDGLDASTATITVRDTSGNPIPNASVVIVPSSGPASAPGLTDSGGVAVFWGTNLTEETVTLAAHVTTAAGTVILTQQPQVQFARSCTAVSATNSTVSVAPACALSNGTATATVTVTVRDASNAVIPNAAVTLAQGAGSSIISPPSVLTNASGVATFTATNATAQTVTYTATATTGPGAVAITQTAQALFATSCSSVSAALTTVTAAPACTLANGSATSTVTVTVRDSAGVPVSGATVALGQGAGTTTVSAPAYAGGGGSTNATGVATFTVSAAAAQTATYAATVTVGSTPTTATQTASVQFATSCTPVLTVSTSRIDGPGAGACVAAGTTSPTITVRLRDAAGLPYTASSSVTLVASPATNLTITPSATQTGITSGTATFAVLSTVAQTVTFTATATGPSGTVTVSTPSSVSGNVVTYQSASCTTTTTTSSGGLTATKSANNRLQVFRPGANVDFTISIQNSSGTQRTDVQVRDAREDGFASFDTSSLTVSPSSGTQGITSSQLDVTNLTVATSGSTILSYREKLESGADLVDAVGMEVDADPRTDDAWWADSVEDSRTNGSDHNDDSDALGHPDGAFLALGGSSATSVSDTIYLSNLPTDTSFVLVEFDERLLVDGSGDDLFVLTRRAQDDTDEDEERYAVYASQDRSIFRLMDRDVRGSQGIDLSSTDIDWARQVLIVDQTPDEDTAGDYPGVEIDAVGLIHPGALVRNTATVSSASANATLNPAEDIAVDLTSALDASLDPDDFLGVNSAGTTPAALSAERSSAVGDPCYSTGTGSGQGGDVTFTLRDVDGSVVPGQLLTIVPSIASGVTVTPSSAVTNALGAVTVRLTSTVEQTVDFSFQATVAGTTAPQTVYRFTGVFRRACVLPQTGSGDRLLAGLLAGSMIPAALIVRRRRTGEA